jgi:hypothetical protein
MGGNVHNVSLCIGQNAREPVARYRLCGDDERTDNRHMLIYADKKTRTHRHALTTHHTRVN